MRLLVSLNKKSRRILVKFFISTYVAYCSIWQILEPINSFLPNFKIEGSIKFGLVILLSFFAGFAIAKPLKNIKIKVNSTQVEIIYGDIFNIGEHRVIPVNEFFDSEIGLPVSPNSLHGKFIQSVLGGQSKAFNELVDNALANVEYAEVPREKGRTRRFPIGTTAIVDILNTKYFLVALARTNLKNFKATASKGDLCDTYNALWDKIRMHANGNNIVIPLIGGGLSGVDLTHQQLLDYLLNSLLMQDEFVANRVTVVLYQDTSDEIDLDLIRDNWTKIG